MAEKTLLSRKLTQTGLSQIEIAEKVKSSQAYISQVMNGKKLQFNAIQKFADAFGFDPYEIHRDFDKPSSDFLSSIAIEPAETYPDPMKQLADIQAGKKKNKNSHQGHEVNEDDLVAVKTFIIPVKGFAGLKQHFFEDDYISGTFGQTVTYVKKSEHISRLYKIQADGDSMPPLIASGDYCNCEPISDLTSDYRFSPDRIYCFFHHSRGILFKRAHNKDFGRVELASDNPDKDEYPNETFDIGEFKKILIVRTIEKQV